MKGFFEKIEATDFRKPFKRLTIITLVVLIGCCAFNAFMFRTQLKELTSLDRAEHQYQQVDSQAHESEHGDHEHDDELNVFEAGLVTRPSTAAIVTAITSIVLCSLCALAYWLMVAAWLYKASSKAGMNRAMWSALGLVFNILAVIAFLIVRGRMTHCHNCGSWQSNAKFCTNCGAAFEQVCPKCGKVCKANDKFCPNCGFDLENSNTDEVKA